METGRGGKGQEKKEKKNKGSEIRGRTAERPNCYLNQAAMGGKNNSNDNKKTSQ